MSSFLLGVILFSVFGIVMLTTQSLGSSLATPSDINKMTALDVSDSSGSTLLGLDLGTSDNISSVTLTFNLDILDSSTVNISLNDIDNIEIGSGSVLISSPTTTVVINLSDTVTNAERNILRSALVSVT